MNTPSPTNQQNEIYDDDLYRPIAKAKVLPSPQHVDDSSLSFYRQHGYLAVGHVLTSDEIEKYLKHMDDLVNGQIPGYHGVQAENNIHDNRHDIDHVRKLFFQNDECHHCGMPVEHPVILEIVRKLMGDTDPQIFQTMALLKPPKIGREKPWHQDHAYFDVALQDRIVGVWIALDHATIENGCMQVIDAGHLPGPVIHFKRRDWQICDNDMLGKASLAVELKPGEALFFDSLLPHGTPANQSPKRRRAMQFHYAPMNAQAIDEADRLAVFGSEGKNVEC